LHFVIAFLLSFTVFVAGKGNKREKDSLQSFSDGACEGGTNWRRRTLVVEETIGLETMKEPSVTGMDNGEQLVRLANFEIDRPSAFIFNYAVN